MAEKRKAGRPKKSGTPHKRASTRGIQAEATELQKERSPVEDVVVELPEDEKLQPSPLPNRILDSKPLPTLAEPQPLNVPDDEYQSIALSSTLLPALERSRQRWLSGDFLDKYWVKANARKDAKNAPAPPPNNPQKSWMKEIGPCVFIVEPMIYEAMVYLSRDPAITASTHPGPIQQSVAHSATQGGSNTVSPYGTPYRPQPITQQISLQSQLPHLQSRGLPLSGQSAQHTDVDRPFLPINSGDSSQNRIPPSQSASLSFPQTVSAKPQPDPVIQMLATRASTDRDLKDLMKVVATGSADQEQLRRFQKHIDELNIVIQSQKSQAPTQAQTAQHSAANIVNSALPATNCANINASRTATPQMQPQPLLQQRSATQPAQAKRQLVNPNYPVVIEFHGPSASQDRFLFPPYSIVEPLGSYSILASFLVFRKGSEASNPSLFEPDTEYFEPITVKIDVAPKFTDVLEHMKRSVKPQEEVRNWMNEKMQSCKRAPIRCLPLRLPHKTQVAETEDAEVIATIPDAKKPKTTVKKEKAAETAAEGQRVETFVRTAAGRGRTVKKLVRIGNIVAG